MSASLQNKSDAGSIPVFQRLSRTVDATSHAYDVIALRCAVALLAAMILLVAVQVFFRYALNHPIAWSEETTTYLFGWVIFLGATVTIRRDASPNLTIVVDALPPEASAFVRTLANVLGLVLSVILLAAAVRACASLQLQRTPVLQISLAYPFLILPLAAVGFTLHFLTRVLQQMRSTGLARGALSTLVVLGLSVLAFWVPQEWSLPALLAVVISGFVIGLPIGFALIWGVIFVLLMQQQPLMIAPQTMFSATSNFILTAVPFFMFTGAVMETGGMAERLVAFANSLVGRFRGGLLYTDIVASAIFADMSGSAVSDTAAIGSVMLPGMIRRGYAPAFSTALQAAAGTLGVLIPPSIATIIYCWAANVSVAQMFLASCLPALIVALSFAVICFIVARRDNYPREPAASPREVLRLSRDAVWALLTPALILGGIFSGAVTPTEAGVIAALYSVFASACLYRGFSVAGLWGSLEVAVLSTARVMFVLGAAVLLGWELIMLQVPQALSQAMLSLSGHPMALLLLLNLVLIVIHGVLEISATIILVVPLVLPTFVQVGIDPTHLGIVFLVNSALGLLTPPLGLVLYVAAPITGLRVETVARAALPFLLALLVDLAIVSFFPKISTIVPALLH